MFQKITLGHVIFVLVAMVLPVIAIVTEMVLNSGDHIWLVMFSMLWFGSGLMIGMGFLK